MASQTASVEAGQHSQTCQAPFDRKLSKLNLGAPAEAGSMSKRDLVARTMSRSKSKRDMVFVPGPTTGWRLSQDYNKPCGQLLLTRLPLHTKTGLSHCSIVLCIITLCGLHTANCRELGSGDAQRAALDPAVTWSSCRTWLMRPWLVCRSRH